MRRIHWAAACLMAAAVGAAAWGPVLPRPARGQAPPVDLPRPVVPPAAENAAEAPPAVADPDRPPPTVTRVYNVAEFLEVVADVPFHSALIPPTMVDRAKWPRGGGTRGGEDAAASGLFGPSSRAGEDPAFEKRADELLRVIQSTIAPDSWREAGGSVGAIRAIGHQLIVTQTAENHAQLATLLNELRQAGRPNAPVSVDAHWVLLAPGELRSILKDGQDEAAPVAGGEVDPAALAKLGKGGLHTEAHLVCSNGQLVHLTSGRARTAVVDADAMIGEGVAAYDPDVQQVLAGTVLQVRPTLQGQEATVELRSVVGDWDPPAEPVELRHAGRAAPRPATRPSDRTHGGSTTVDRLNTPAQQLATTARLPLGKPVLVGGMTLEPSVKGGDGRQLYLILRITARESPKP